MRRQHVELCSMFCKSETSLKVCQLEKQQQTWMRQTLNVHARQYCPWYCLLQAFLSLRWKKCYRWSRPWVPSPSQGKPPLLVRALTSVFYVEWTGFSGCLQTVHKLHKLCFATWIFHATRCFKDLSMLLNIGLMLLSLKKIFLNSSIIFSCIYVTSCYFSISLLMDV